MSTNRRIVFVIGMLLTASLFGNLMWLVTSLSPMMPFYGSPVLNVLQNFCSSRSTFTSDGNLFQVRPGSAVVNGQTYSCDDFKGTAEYPSASIGPLECQLQNENGWLLDFVNPGQACAYAEINEANASLCWPEDMPVLGNNDFATWNHATCQWDRHFPAHQSGADITQ